MHNPTSKQWRKVADHLRPFCGGVVNMSIGQLGESRSGYCLGLWYAVAMGKAVGKNAEYLHYSVGEGAMAETLGFCNSVGFRRWFRDNRALVLGPASQDLSVTHMLHGKAFPGIKTVAGIVAYLDALADRVEALELAAGVRGWRLSPDQCIPVEHGAYNPYAGQAREWESWIVFRAVQSRSSTGLIEWRQKERA